MTATTYINSFPDEIKAKLLAIRNLIFELAPEATEHFAYAMPAYKSNDKYLIHFAAYKNHIGLYGGKALHEKFKKELSSYKQSKAAVQFPNNKELPLDLIRKMIAFSVAENEITFKKK